MSEEELKIKELLTNENIVNQKLGYSLAKSVLGWNDRDIAEFILENCMIYKMRNYSYLEYYISIFNGYINLSLLVLTSLGHRSLQYGFRINLNLNQICEIEYLNRPLSRSTIIGDIAFFIAEQNK